MFRKGLAVAVILLFIGVAFAIPINANVSKPSLEPVPDLDCTGLITGIDMELGDTVVYDFTVENIGEEGSLLDWEILSYPDWGTFTFDPDGWIDLPKGAPVTVAVEIVLPDEIEDDLWGDILITNLENPDDNCIIDVFFRIKSIDDAISIEFELQKIRELVQSIDLWKIIVNPDAVLETLEEISSILEEENVRNYIEKTSDEDCDCEDDSSGFEWFFPVICTSLFPLVWLAVALVAGPPHWTFPAEIMIAIGEKINCWWV